MPVLSDRIQKFLKEQLSEWELARTNFEALNGVKTKCFEFEGFVIKVQFNPSRIQSSAAKVDAKSIQERKCFLCSQNLPSVQRGIDYQNKYQILVNPFPIFPEHFTIPCYDHIDQLIYNKYATMLDLAQLLEGYTLFYNGPKCGASAPDHAHFQAGNRGFMPIEEDIQVVDRRIICQEGDNKLFTLKKYFRNILVIETEDKKYAHACFEKIYSQLHILDGEKEPMLNILTWFGNDKWYTVIIVRAKHRPACFYAEDDKNILISPASVDMGGVFITPLDKDFEKIKREDIVSILKEVSLSDNDFEALIDKIK